MRDSRILPSEIKPGLMAISMGRWRSDSSINVDYNDVVVFLQCLETRGWNESDDLDMLWEVINPAGKCHRVRVSGGNFVRLE